MILNKTGTGYNDNTPLRGWVYSTLLKVPQYLENMARRKICGIYKITSPSGKIYIGQSIDCDKRLSGYRKGAKNQPKLHYSILKYGWETHRYEIIHTCNECELNQWEVYYANLYNVYDINIGLNIRECGGSKGKPAKETIEKYKETIRIRQPNKGEKNHFYGKQHSPESRKKMGEKNNGNKYSTGKRTEEQRENIRKGVQNTLHKRIGKKLSKKTKDKQREAAKIRELKKKNNAKDGIMCANIFIHSESGIFYFSCKEAAKALNIDLTTFYRRLRNKKLPLISV